MTLEILIAEDNQYTALQYNRILGKYGHSVVITKDGDECIKKYKEEIKKKKSKNFVLFLPAIAIYLISYVVIQISFEAGINEPRADPLTSLLFGVTDTYLASTISFGLYFLLIIGLYLWAKNHDIIPRMQLPDGGVLTLKKKTNAVLATARLVWLLLIISGGLFLLLMLQDLRSELT